MRRWAGAALAAVLLAAAWLTAPAQEEPRRALAREVLLLRERGPCLPSAADTAARHRIIRDALACDPRPMLPDSARLRLDRGRRALGHCACRDSVRFAEREFAAALHQAPWWGEAYRRLANALLRQARNAEAGLCLDLYLAAEPDAQDHAAVERQATRLLKRRSAAR